MCHIETPGGRGGGASINVISPTCSPAPKGVIMGRRDFLSYEVCGLSSAAIEGPYISRFIGHLNGAR